MDHAAHPQAPQRKGGRVMRVGENVLLAAHIDGKHNHIGS